MLLVVDVHERYGEGCDGTQRDLVRRLRMIRDGRVLGPRGVLHGPLLFPRMR